MRRTHLFITFLIATVLLLSVSMTTAQQTPEATSQAAAPSLQVVDSSPAAGEELAIDQPIKIYLDRPVDCASAQTAFHIDPNAAGTITCDPADASISYQAAANFLPDTTFTVTLDT